MGRLRSVVVNPMIEKWKLQEMSEVRRNKSGPAMSVKTLRSSPSFSCGDASVWVPVTCSHAFRKSVASRVGAVVK